MDTDALFSQLLTTRLQAGITDPERLAFCEVEANALANEVERQVRMSPAERAQHVQRVKSSD